MQGCPDKRGWPNFAKEGAFVTSKVGCQQTSLIQIWPILNTNYLDSDPLRIFEELPSDHYHQAAKRPGEREKEKDVEKNPNATLHL